MLAIPPVLTDYIGSVGQFGFRVCYPGVLFDFSLCKCVAADANIERTSKWPSVCHATSLVRSRNQ